MLDQRRRDKEANTRLTAVNAALGGPGATRTFTFERFLEHPGNTRALALARAFSPTSHNLYLAGGAGVGKTHLAFAVAREMIMIGRTAVVLTVPQLVRQLRMKAPEEEQAVLDRCVRAAVLVLDDLAYGRETPFARQVLQELLDARAFAGRRGLLVTSRLTPREGAPKTVDPSIAARMAGCQVVTMSGPDRRWIAPADCSRRGDLTPQ